MPFRPCPRRLFLFAAAPIATLFVALSLPYCTQAAGAQTPPAKGHVEEVLKGLSQGHRVGPVAISPDGALLAYVRPGKDGSELVVAPFADAAKAARVTAAKKPGEKCGDSDPAWAPDSRRLAFLSDCQSGTQEDVFVAAIGGDWAGGKPKIEVQRLTEVHGEVGYPAFSPDGAQIAFLYVEGATRAAGALAAMKPWAGVIGEDGVEIQRVGIVDAAAKKPVGPSFVTPAKLHVYEFDWSPDSKSLAYVAADPPGENNWWVAKLYTQALSSDPEAGAKAVFAPAESSGPLHGLQIAVPRWSPDGKWIAFIGGLMSDQGSTGGDVWLIPSLGGVPRDLTPEVKASPAWIIWSGSENLYVSELAGGDSELIEIPASAQGAILGAPVYRIPASVGDGRMMMSLSATQDRTTFVFAANSFEHAPEIYAVKSGSPVESSAGLRQLTHINDGIEPVWGSAESLNWKNEGFDVQGWLLKPANYDPSKKYGLIVLVHGGPAAAAQAAWGGRGSLSAPAFSAMGYFVLEPNPRGSYGQGEAFAAANRRDFGYGDLRDILAGVDAVTAKYPAVDPKRVGLTGWSYGGFMTMFAVTQTQRFKAAVAGAGISDWKSYYGENSIDQWMTPYFAASVYKDPAAYAKSSAIDFISQVHTPTLVVVGDRDGECPAPQSFEFWHALRDEHVPTQLVVYPNEGHGFVNPEHRTDVLVRTLDWFAKYMPVE
jgi:dipeptidyl aminopeptidase/acylaminoacyl peptidase